MDPMAFREMENQIISALTIPPYRMGVPVNDGNWTTLYADQLDQLGLPDAARRERREALGPEIRDQRIP